jgi:hypothetical protein
MEKGFSIQILVTGRNCVHGLVHAVDTTYLDRPALRHTSLPAGSVRPSLLSTRAAGPVHEARR